MHMLLSLPNDVEITFVGDLDYYSEDIVNSTGYYSTDVSNNSDLKLLDIQEMCIRDSNYIEGLFLSSGVVRSPDYTMERMLRVVKELRTVHRFGGYIHMKSIPDVYKRQGYGRPAHNVRPKRAVGACRGLSE